MKNKLLIIFVLILTLCTIFLTACETAKDSTGDNAVNAYIKEETTKTDNVPEETSKVEQQQNEIKEQSTVADPEITEEKVMEQKTEEENICTLSVQCKIILSNMDKLKKEKQNCVPADGIIFGEKTAKFSMGESVFDVLLREMQNSKIHMEFTKTPMYKSMYIKGINNLYEFDCGELSGWTYRVNGEFQSVGCSQYILKPGDKVEWIYSCDLGRDIN